MNPGVAAFVAQYDANLNAADVAIKHKLFKADGPGIGKLADLNRVKRNQLAVYGMWLKAIENERTNKEIVKEKQVIIKVRCPHCHNLYEEIPGKCPYCGGKS